MNRWKWLVFTGVPLLLLVAAFAFWDDCLADSMASRGKTDLLRTLVNLGANVNGSCHGFRPLTSAVKARQQDTVNYLLSIKADVNVHDEDLATPLMRAAEQKQMDISRRLIAAGADVNAFDANGRTALNYAIRAGSVDLAAMLIKSGANPNNADSRDDTPLMQATQSNNVEMARMLLKSGADPMLQDKAGRTAFEFIGHTSDPDLVPLLRNVYFVPIVEAPMDDINDLVQHYREKLGIEVHVLPAMMPKSTDIDTARGQLIAENVLESMARNYPEYEKNKSAILIGITALDMYPTEEKWQFCYGWRDPELRKAVISTARFNWQYPGEPVEEASMTQRLRKAVTKDIGLMYFWKPLNHNPKSVLYDGIMGIDDLDRASENF